jgi:hypothetical protein
VVSGSLREGKRTYKHGETKRNNFATNMPKIITKRAKAAVLRLVGANA